MDENRDLKTEVELVCLAKQGNKRAFGQLVEQMQRSVYALVFQKVADADAALDLTQTVFLQAFRSLPSLREPRKFRSWLYRLTIRISRRWLAKKAKRSVAERSERLARELGGPNRVEVDSQAPAEIALRRERQAAVLQALGELPDKYRTVLTLKYLEGLSAAGIARRLDEPAGSVRSKLFRAHKLLRKKLSRWL